MVEHKTQITVRYYETDQMGVVHHSNYIRYFETAREEMMAHIGVPYTYSESQGIIMPVRVVHCDYIHPARYGQVLTVTTTVNEMPRSRITYHYQVFDDSGVLLATGYVTLAFVDTSRGVPVRAPRFLTEVLEKYINLKKTNQQENV
ncbi:MAG: acyl-CoA thioesterase [Bacteroidales bacterium]|jgi:acyl-CoA thioester hydrolase|nr:acyl-CoA thioesterase [Bacteroidales bacterium]NLH23445.1 acyl-CoA thioesterase [Bacteroidales bacterium]HPJ82888.1 thioesterase family protein [Bacteroidales bacterium]